MSEETVDHEWLAFRGRLERGIGIPLGAYKEPRLKRRLHSVMTRHRLPSWAAFGRAIESDGVLLGEVRNTVTINVSEFFRQPERFLEIQQRLLPGMLKQGRPLRFWSAGCSIGCEPYTLAILLEEADPRGSHTVIATDVDLPVLTRAKTGKGYVPNDVRSVPAALLRKHFVEECGTYRVSEAVRQRVTFRCHDLLSDAYPESLDLILCRNVVIYFTEEAKQKVYTGFARSLRLGGYLFLGGSEMIMRSSDIGLRVSGTSLYQLAA
ncbi:MAG: protein-glutamate O-methyltransferase CheR [Dehalococcoidia bacterium]|nr:protein-glutamate O-methyltransferase CheR [Dehalococcoidia bacterium]